MKISFYESFLTTHLQHDQLEAVFDPGARCIQNIGF